MIERYISVEDIRKVSNPNMDEGVKQFVLIRCKDCRWCKIDGGFRRCMMSAIVHPTAEDYCSLGERNEDEIVHG